MRNEQQQQQLAIRMTISNWTIEKKHETCRNIHSYLLSCNGNVQQKKNEIMQKKLLRRWKLFRKSNKLEIIQITIFVYSIVSGFNSHKFLSSPSLTRKKSFFFLFHRLWSDNFSIIVSVWWNKSTKKEKCWTMSQNLMNEV